MGVIYYLLSPSSQTYRKSTEYWDPYKSVQWDQQITALSNQQADPGKQSLSDA